MSRKRHFDPDEFEFGGELPLGDDLPDWGAPPAPVVIPAVPAAPSAAGRMRILPDWMTKRDGSDEAKRKARLASKSKYNHKVRGAPKNPGGFKGENRLSPEEKRRRILESKRKYNAKYHLKTRGPPKNPGGFRGEHKLSPEERRRRMLERKRKWNATRPSRAKPRPPPS